MIVSLLLAATIVAPHLYWLSGPGGYLGQLRQSIALKTGGESADTLYFFGPLFSFLWTSVRLLWPLFVILAGALFFKKVKLRPPKWDWFTKMALAQALVLMLFFRLFNVHKVEERWLLPLLLPFILWIFLSVRFNKEAKWAANLYLVFCVVLLLQVIRTPMEKVLGIPSSVHFGFGPLSKSLNLHYSNRPWVLPDVTYAGNIRLLNPEREVFAADDFSLPVAKRYPVNGIGVAIGDTPSADDEVLRTLAGFGKQRDTLYFFPINNGHR